MDEDDRCEQEVGSVNQLLPWSRGYERETEMAGFPQVKIERHAPTLGLQNIGPNAGTFLSQRGLRPGKKIPAKLRTVRECLNIAEYPHQDLCPIGHAISSCCLLFTGNKLIAWLVGLAFRQRLEKEEMTAQDTGR
jgi:hypothetical protein